MGVDPSSRTAGHADRSWQRGAWGRPRGKHCTAGHPSRSLTALSLFGKAAEVLTHLTVLDQPMPSLLHVLVTYEPLLTGACEDIRPAGEGVHRSQDGGGVRWVSHMARG